MVVPVFVMAIVASVIAQKLFIRKEKSFGM